ncbi:MAG: DUF4249 domain-containing protein [Bacteroidales bacterium]|nr:DUF4249 domain-containing protein [Bacteroidales bacterium]
MKKISAYIACLLLLMTACIEEYHGDWESENEETLVVSGSIEGEHTCTFVLRKSVPINSGSSDDYMYYSDVWTSSVSAGNKSISPYMNYVRDAVVTVESENGVVYEAYESDLGEYSVVVGKLNPEDKYFLRIYLPDEDEVYTSKPMKPLDTSKITSAGWRRDGDEVQIHVSTEDPGEPTYYIWDYVDIWEIQTPFAADYEYDPDLDAIVRTTRKNRGWITERQHQRIVGSNKNYGNGALKRCPVYNVNKDDQRFQVRYYTRIRQSAICKEEYEYNNLILLYNNQMGGLFTPMPSELPTNIYSESGKKGVGFVGVRGSTSEAEICISEKQVGCGFYMEGSVVDQEITDALSYYECYERGYSFYTFKEPFHQAVWTYESCIDARCWGASLERPDFWGEIETTPEDNGN